MFRYECKKIFNKRLSIILLVILALVVSFFTFAMYQTSSNSFWEYRSFFWLYGIAILYIIIFVNVTIFTIEEKNDMSSVLMISKLGREALANSKLLLALLVTNIAVILFLATSLFGYVVVFSSNFDIAILEEEEIIINIANSSVQNYGEMLMVMMLGFIFSANFTALFALYLSKKLKSSYLTCILLFFGCFLAMFNITPEFGTFSSFLPLGNYIVNADALQIMYTLGPVAVTPHFISLLITLILILLLIFKVKSVYKTRNLNSI